MVNKRIIDISLLRIVGKIYAGNLVDKVHRMTEGLIENEQGGFGAGSGCVGQILTLKQIDEKARVKKLSVCEIYGFKEGV